MDIIVPQPVDSGKEKASTSGDNSFSDNPKSLPNGRGQDENGQSDFDADYRDEDIEPDDVDVDYRLLDPDEIDPNPSKLPPPFRDALQAALNAHQRGFELIQLGPDGAPLAADWHSAAVSDDAVLRDRWSSAPRCKVGAATDGLVVLALTGADGVAQYAAMAEIANTAAVVSRAPERILLFFRLPAGVRSLEGELLPGVDVLSTDGYVELPSGGVTDAVAWTNRYPIAAAPQWLLGQLNQLAALAATQSQTKGNNEMSTRNEVTERLRNGLLPTAAAPIAKQLDETEAADELEVIADEEKDTSEIGPPEPLEPSNVVAFSPKPRGLGSYLEQAAPRAAAGAGGPPEIGSRAAAAASDSGDTEAAIEFLIALDPDGRHDLAAIHPETEAIECATFFANDERLRHWIKERQGKVSLYTSVHRARDNAPHDARLNYAKRKEIGQLRAIVSDIDVPKEGDASGERFRLGRAKLFEELIPHVAADHYPPSFIVDSGGGAQLWWLLDAPLEATPENVELVKGIGRTIRDRIRAEFQGFKPDTVSDPARLMRLPGTINMPNAGKRKEGRSPAPATVLRALSSEDRYSLAELEAWAPPTSAPPSSASNEERRKLEMELREQWSVVCEASEYEDLRTDLRKRFESACERNPAGLDRLWKEGALAIRGDDTSRSVQVSRLGALLKHDGRFTPAEFGMLVWVWPHGYSNEPEKITARLISRAWVNNDAQAPTAEGFSAQETDESKHPRHSGKPYRGDGGKIFYPSAKPAAKRDDNKTDGDDEEDGDPFPDRGDSKLF
jgi:Bifunctional DNA primase/polymerase, N-terminal